MSDKYRMEIDNQSEDGELTRTPENEATYGYQGEEDADTADSLEIKPPQAVVRHHKSSHRREKHPDRSNRRDTKDRKSRHHDHPEERHRDKHGRHRRHDAEALERSKRSDPVKRPDMNKRHERKERSNTNPDRVLEDLRESNVGRSNSNHKQPRKTEERLLDKRRERRDETREMREFKCESRRDIREEPREIRERREPRIEDNRDSRMRMSGEKRQLRPEESFTYTENETVNRSREKRHKRSHKHEKIRDKDREKFEKLEREVEQQKRARAMEMVYEEFQGMENLCNPMALPKESKSLTEQELRTQRLLVADREMARIKEKSRYELQVRRQKKREEKRHVSPDVRNVLSVVDISDDSPIMIPVDQHSPKSVHSKQSSEDAQETQDGSDNEDSSDSSDSSSDDDDDDSDDTDDSNDSDETNGNSDYNNPSPLSVDQLAKSDHSEVDSPGHIDSNGTTKELIEEIKEEEPELPPYFPAIQGCRSVEEYKCLNRIAEGTYGVVYRAEDRRTKEIVALKRLKMEKEKDGFPITSLREINTLLKAQHPNIVTVREIVVGSNMDKIFIVMDYVEHDLKSLMETMKAKNQVFLPGEVKCLMQQLLRAVAHLHDNWILHRDLKTSNLLLSHRGILKVGDFGLAREYGSPLKQYTSVVVTLWYRAPELLLGGKEYSTPIDMWSVGCIFAELLRMEALFPGKSEIDLLNRVFKELGTPNEKVWPGYSKLPMVKKIPFAQYPVNNLRQRFNLSLTDLGIELLNKMLTYDPTQRITADTALNHTYFKESPLPIDPDMFPTWPAKSEFGARVINASPKPPSGGKEFKQLSDEDELDINAAGFHMGGSREASRQPLGGGFHLKF